MNILSLRDLVFMAENLCDYKINRKLFDTPENVNNNNNNFQTPHSLTNSSTESDENGFEDYLSKVRLKSPVLKESPTVIIVSDSSDVEYGSPGKRSEIETLEKTLLSLEISKPELIVVESDSSCSDTEIFSTPLSKPLLHSNFVTPRTVHTPIVPSSLNKKFNSNRDTLADSLYYLYNETVFSSQLPKDLKIIWNKNLTKTAGYCVYKFDKSHDTIQRHISINLSTKIITDEDRLKATLIHEMCHAATWIINGVKEGHGPIWKGWAYKASQVYPDYPPITRCHSFSIETKFKYKCTNCYYTIGRHSKSIDTATKCCPLCRSKIELVPLTDKKGNPRKLNLFAEYVKENYGGLERNLTHRDKMKCLSENYKELKLQSTPI